MPRHYRYLVVGRGMMGAAAARYLSAAEQSVAVLGPDEPVDKNTHKGVFSSHYDEGRITRTIDPHPDWALLANRSISRYAEIEAASGIKFYHEVGNLLTGPARGGSNAYIEQIVDAAQALGVDADVLDDAGLAERFPFFSFVEGTEAVYQRNGAGYISPRGLVAAQTICAEKNGADIIRDYAVGVDEQDGVVRVTTSSGDVVTADKVLVAAGGFTIQNGLLPDPLDLTVYARTIAFFEIGEDEASRLRSMPSMINETIVSAERTYMLPAIRYPDGKIYLKIGGDPVDVCVNDDEALRAWFRSDGSNDVAEHLTARMKALMPDLAIRNVTSGSCVTSFTPSGVPAIGWTSSSRIAVLSGGCGAAAKSSDEIGRLGAELLLEDGIKTTGYVTDFAPQFR